MKDQLLSIPEAARELGGISVWTVRAWLTQGRLRRTKVGRRTLIRSSELARVINDGAEVGPRNVAGVPTSEQLSNNAAVLLAKESRQHEDQR
jgi:excisionase family DNA binding protein